jgi:hypothetical protein
MSETMKLLREIGSHDQERVEKIASLLAMELWGVRLDIDSRVMREKSYDVARKILESLSPQTVYQVVDGGFYSHNAIAAFTSKERAEACLLGYVTHPDSRYCSHGIEEIVVDDPVEVEKSLTGYFYEIVCFAPNGNAKEIGEIYCWIRPDETKIVGEWTQSPTTGSSIEYSGRIITAHTWNEAMQLARAIVEMELKP